MRQFMREMTGSMASASRCHKFFDVCAQTFRVCRCCPLNMWLCYSAIFLGLYLHSGTTKGKALPAPIKNWNCKHSLTKWIKKSTKKTFMWRKIRASTYFQLLFLCCGVSTSARQTATFGGMHSFNSKVEEYCFRSPTKAGIWWVSRNVWLIWRCKSNSTIWTH